MSAIPIDTWLTVVAWIFISLGLASAAVIVADIYLLGYREHPKIMEAVWPLTALYAGPAGLAAYFRWGRPMSHRWMQARHNRMRAKPFWAGTAVSTTHCGAGCAVGDLIAEWIVFAAALQLLGLALPAEYLLDFTLAISWGILFQYFVIAPMRRLSLGNGLRLAAKADVLALSAFEVGLFGWMAIFQLVLFTSPRLPVSSAAYWFMMQIGMLIGFATSYPMNRWLIRHGIKDVM
jgi:hypothetical protein